MGWQAHSNTRRSGGGLIKKFLLPLLISVAFFFLLLHTVPLHEIARTFSKIGVPQITSAFLLYTLSQITRSFRWKFILRELGFREAFLINSANIFLNNLLPARTGELSWFYYARRLGVELKSSLWGFFLGRAYDLLGLLALFLISYTLLLGIVHFLSALLLLMLLSLSVPCLRFLIPPLGKLEDFREFIGRELTPSLSFKLTALSTLSFLFKALSVYALIAVILKTDLFKFSFAFAGGELTTILPVHGFMGYGTYEAGFLIPLKFMGVEIREGLRVGFLAHTFLLVSSAVWGLLSIPLLHTLSRRSP